MSKKTTKRALAMSFVSVFLCVCMLVGTTFAWFTDSVTSENNIIKAGTLDVTMEWKDATANGAQQTYKDASTGAIFDYAKWEPGYVAAKNVKISNEGTLALKYKLNIVPSVTPAAGEANLADVIEVYFADSAVTSDRNLTGLTKVGTLSALMADADGAAYGYLLAGSSTEVTIALKMQETADNKYQDLSVGDGFKVQLLATQKDAEFDSFDNTYDQFADYDGEISTAATLAAALAKGGTYKLTGDIVVDETVEIPANVSVNLDLGGKTITSSVTAIKNSGILNIVGGTMENTKTNGGAVINNAGTLTLDDVTINGAPIDATGYPAYAVITSGKLTVEDGTTIDTNRGAISMSDGAEVVINGGNLKVSDDADGRNMTLHTIYAYGYNSKLTINGGFFEQNHTSTGGASVICPAGATINVYGGDFRDAMDDSIWTSTGNFQNYMGYGDTLVKVYGGTYDDMTHQRWLAPGYVSVDNGDGTYTVSMTQATVNDAITNAANNGTPVTLSAGNYVMPDSFNGAGADLQGKTLTIKGTKDTVIDVSNVDTRDQFVTGATMVFDGVTLNFNDGSGNIYMGFANTASLTYKNCKITGMQFLYGENVTFENCVIDSSANTGEPHAVWTYGAKNVTFTDCEFIYGDRAVNCYKDQDIDGGKQVVNFKNCTFTTTKNDSEGAVEINSSAFSVGIEVNMDGCTAPAKGDMVFISKWDGTNGAMTTINVNGTKIDNATVDHN